MNSDPKTQAGERDRREKSRVSGSNRIARP